MTGVVTSCRAPSWLQPRAVLSRTPRDPPRQRSSAPFYLKTAATRRICTPACMSPNIPLSGSAYVCGPGLHQTTAGHRHTDPSAQHILVQARPQVLLRLWQLCLQLTAEPRQVPGEFPNFPASFETWPQPLNPLTDYKQHWRNVGIQELDQRLLYLAFHAAHPFQGPGRLHPGRPAGVGAPKFDGDSSAAVRLGNCWSLSCSFQHFLPCIRPLRRTLTIFPQNIHCRHS